MIFSSCVESKEENINRKNNVIELVKWKKIKKKTWDLVKFSVQISRKRFRNSVQVKPIC